MKQQLYIVKIGGNFIDSELELNRFLSDFVKIKAPKILVHGGGKIADQMATLMGVQQHMIEGRRITDAETLKITTMVYAGLLNKNIVASLQGLGLNAIGLCGADGDMIRASKRDVNNIDFGFVGDINKNGINIPMIDSLLNLKLTPVFSAITHDGFSQLLNTNADTIAATLAIALSRIYEVQLNYCFEKNGVLTDINKDDSVIKLLTMKNYETFKLKGVISKGMIPKLDNAFDALAQGVRNVFINHANQLLSTCNSQNHEGTQLIIN